MAALLSAIGNALTNLVAWLGTVLDAILGETGALAELLPFLAISIGISLFMLGIRVLRGFIWGD